MIKVHHSVASQLVTSKIVSSLTDPTSLRLGATACELMGFDSVCSIKNEHFFVSLPFACFFAGVNINFL